MGSSRPESGEQLINELCADSKRFEAEGRSYDLLQAYFAGQPVETLSPLLESTDPLVQRVAVFVASELGPEVCQLVEDVIPLLATGNRYLQYHALEIVARCSTGMDARRYAHVVLALESDDQVLRALAMRLLSRADLERLKAAKQVLGASNPSLLTHQRGLGTLLAAGRIAISDVTLMIHDADPLLRRYGAIAASRLSKEAMQEVAASDDSELVDFYRRLVGSDSDRTESESPRRDR